MPRASTGPGCTRHPHAWAAGGARTPLGRIDPHTGRAPRRARSGMAVVQPGSHGHGVAVVSRGQGT